MHTPVKDAGGILKQCRPWSDCSYFGAIWAGSDLSVPIFRSFMVINITDRIFFDVKCKCPESTWSKQKACIFPPAKRHLDSVVLRFPFKGKACTFTYVFGSRCYGHLTKGLADSVSPDHTTSVQSDQDLHYLPTLSTLFAYKDKMSKN